MKTIPSFTRDLEPTPPDILENAGPDFDAIQRSPEFGRLRKRLAWFVFPMSAFFLTWYLTYVVLAAYANDFMSQRVFGNVTIGLLLGLSQFVTTVVIMLWYTSFARRRIDPQIDDLTDRMGSGRP